MKILTLISNPMGRLGQSLTEYMVLMVIVTAALITTSVYIKRGIQGMWIISGEDGFHTDVGPLYDPRTGHSHTIQHLISNAMTVAKTETVYGPSIGGGESFATNAHTQTNSIEWIDGNIENGGS